MPSSLKFSFAIFVACSIFLQGALAVGDITCEDLPRDRCAFAIASSGKRCLLETFSTKDGNVLYQCTTSNIVVDNMSSYVETDRCVRACGVDRKMIGISSDAFLEPLFTAKLCSPACYLNCPNVVDLYYNLASGEGVFLPDLCESQRSNPHRSMTELMSNGAASGPASSWVPPYVTVDHLTPTPAPAPSAWV